MKKLRFLFPLIFLVKIAVFSTAILLLWNWLMPVIFGLSTITFWQAIGLFGLSRILFGKIGCTPRGMPPHFRKRKNLFRERWENMDPEKRRDFFERRKRFRNGGPFGYHGHRKSDTND